MSSDRSVANGCHNKGNIPEGIGFLKASAHHEHKYVDETNHRQIVKLGQSLTKQSSKKRNRNSMKIWNSLKLIETRFSHSQSLGEPTSLLGSFVSLRWCSGDVPATFHSISLGVSLYSIRVPATTHPLFGWDLVSNFCFKKCWLLARLLQQSRYIQYSDYCAYCLSIDVEAP